MSTIGVGVLGASPLSPGWAIATHIPAIRALAGFELRAVGTSRRESADAAAQAFGVPAFDNPHALIAHPGVDLVVVAVKAPDHHALISAALASGKMVFSEWPLGINLDEAAALDELASVAGVRTVIGLQARFAPAVQHARDLIAQGYIGEVLATTLVGSAISWGGRAPRGQAYLYDAVNGVSALSVPMLHALEAVNYVLGDFSTVTAVCGVRRPWVRIVEDGSSIPATATDHVALAGTLRSGVVVSAFYRGEVSRGENLRWEINGTHGDLVLTAANGNLQVADLQLAGGHGAQESVIPIELPEHFARAPGGLSGELGANILREYAAFARDIRDGTQLVPDFAYARRRHELLATIEHAAVTGITQPVAT